jgi:hypothetical protein
MTSSKIDKRVIEGFRLPNDGPASQNEMQWIQLLRLIFRDDVPPPQMGAARARQMLCFGGALETQPAVQQREAPQFAK